ncbi:DUF2690 domain-containing protein [Kribbella sp. CA-253562]|uniref:DUF2690 domain-containing protein n=1 Tax=Kribbella sp. CA-253562 TaxID=3239942 RepID=UPI003D8AF652
MTAPSAPAASCTWNGCTGKDPQASGCANDAVTSPAHDVTFNDRLGTYRVELRYSGSCHAVWVRMTSTSCSAPRAYMETGYFPIGDGWVMQGRYLGHPSYSGCSSPIVASWTAMSSFSRERIWFGYASYNGTPQHARYIDTGCDDCKG